MKSLVSGLNYAHKFNIGTEKNEVYEFLYIIFMLSGLYKN